MKLYRKDTNTLIYSETLYFIYIVGALCFGVGIYSFAQFKSVTTINDFVFVIIFPIIGLLLVLFTKSRSAIFNKNDNSIVVETRSVIKREKFDFKFSDVGAVEVETSYSSNKNSPDTPLYGINLIFKNGEKGQLSYPSSSSTSRAMTSFLVPKPKQFKIAEEIAIFLNVKLYDRSVAGPGEVISGFIKNIKR